MGQMPPAKRHMDSCLCTGDGAEEAARLAGCLSTQDACLSPQGVGRDPLHQALLAFAGAPGGPLPSPWPAASSGERCLAQQSGPADDLWPDEQQSAPHALAGEAGSSGKWHRDNGALPAGDVYPQAKALGPALAGLQLGLLGTLLASVSPVNQARHLSHEPVGLLSWHL